MTYNFPISECVFHNSESATYRSIFSKEEKERVLHLVKKVFHRNFTNECGTRICRCEKQESTDVFYLEDVYFYDFLTSNYALFNFDELLLSADAKESELLWKLKNQFQNDGEADSVQNILNRNYLANAVAVSLLIGDAQGRYLLAKRNNSVGISNGFVAVSVTGTVSKEDLLTDNPFRSCCARELGEELGYSVDPSRITPFMLVCGEKKLQPIVLANLKVDDINEIVSTLTEHADFALENSGFLICNRVELASLLENPEIKITESCRTHIESAIKDE